VRDILAELIHAKDFGPSPVPRTGEEVVLPHFQFFCQK
jgi:hypothetical protein